MSYESNITAADMLFAGEDKTLSYEIFAADQEDTPDALMENVTGMSLQWELRKLGSGQAPHRAQGPAVLSKTTAAGSIAFSGVYNSARAVNTQRVLVPIADTETEALAGGRYVCALKRMDPGLEAVLSHSVVELLVTAIR